MLTTEQKKQVEDIFYTSLKYGACSFLVCIWASVAVNAALESNEKASGMILSVAAGTLTTVGMFRRMLNKVTEETGEPLVLRP